MKFRPKMTTITIKDFKVIDRSFNTSERE